MRFGGLFALRVLLVLGLASRVNAVIFIETGDPLHNSSTPGDNSGWQYEGKFMSFLGVPIAPHFFITAAHFEGSVGTVFDFHGDGYTTIAIHDVPLTDLRIWEVDHVKPFPTYAPLSSGAADIGGTATVLGRGTQRGVEVIVSGGSKGWKWGTGDGVQRWGRNTVVDRIIDVTLGEFLYCDFDKPGLEDECHLSTGDSGGGMFVLEDGLWRLAGINYGVDGPFRTGPADAGFHAMLYDAGGLEYYNGAGWTGIPEQTEDVPSRFYCSRISASLPLILGVTGQDGSLSAESYSAWLSLYFTPAQIATPAITGPLADYDGDGIANLLEFALNLDPTFNERAIMLSDSGLRGLPVVRLENISGTDRLTLEFVRRTGGSGSGLIYSPRFSSDLEDWQAVGTESVVAINPRWERVKIVDSLTTNDTAKRFARVKVTLEE